MHTDTAKVTASLRADTSFAYIDDSEHVAGEPDMGCLLLNLSKAPFDNLKVRQATAYAISSAQYAEVIDHGVNLPSNGPFTTDLALLSRRQRLPGVQPGQGHSSWSTRSSSETGQPVTVGPQPHPRLQHHARSPSTCSSSCSRRA